MTIHEFYKRVAQRMQYVGKFTRYGQAVWHIATEFVISQEEAQEIIMLHPEIDPYHSDENVCAFVTYLNEKGKLN